MPQLSYQQDPEIGVAGQLADNGPFDVMSGMSATRKLVSVAVGASNSQTYTITINGTDFTFVADGSATTAEITVGLRDAINAGDEPVLATGTDTPLLIESTIDGAAGDFTYADSAGTGTLTETVLVVQGQEIGFGKFVCLDERSGEDQAVRLPRRATDITGGRHLGVVLDDRAREDHEGDFRANTMIPVLVEGRVYVEVEQAVTKGDDVFVRFAAGGSGVGSFGNTSGTSERAQVPRAVYRTSAASGELAVVELFG